jgi:ceramide glucosyltransferase
MAPLPAWQWALLAPVVAGSLYSLACLATLRVVVGRARRPRPAPEAWPPVTVLKPVCGLEKGLRENLRSACLQDYPELQVVLSAQERDDPALPLLHEVEREFGPGRVTVVAAAGSRAANGKIRNLIGAFPHARHDTLVTSDSDVRLRPDYLKAVVAPLADPAVGVAGTFYRAMGAEAWYERMEQLTINAELVPHFVFAHVTGAARFVHGASNALRRSTLEEIGGFAARADSFVEDDEMARRVLATGGRIALVPYFVDMTVSLDSPSRWWNHLVYWDQVNRAVNPAGVFATVILKAIPFALFFALARLLDALGLEVLAAAVALRLAVSAAFLRLLGDRDLASLALLPLRDLVGLASWALAFTRTTVVWRGAEFVLTGGRRMVPKSRPGAASPTGAVRS